MKKIVFRFWIINFLMSNVLFIIYRIVIAENTINGNLFEQLMQFLELLLNIFFAFIYLIAMIISSFTVLLNLIEKIRNNFYLSLLTFLGIPSFCVIFIMIKVLIDFSINNLTILKTLAIFSITYLFLTAIQFLLFRKKYNLINKKLP